MLSKRASNTASNLFVRFHSLKLCLHYCFYWFLSSIYLHPVYFIQFGPFSVDTRITLVTTVSYILYYLSSHRMCMDDLTLCENVIASTICKTEKVAFPNTWSFVISFRYKSMKALIHKC